MPHSFKCQIQTYEMLGTQPPLFASLFCLGHICMDFFLLTHGGRHIVLGFIRL